MLDDVEQFRLLFLDSLGSVDTAGKATTLDTRDWVENWVPDSSAPDQSLAPPLAVEVRLELADWGEMRRIYALPPL